MDAFERLIANTLFNRGGYRSPFEDLPADADPTRLAELYASKAYQAGDRERAEIDCSAIELHVRLLAQVHFDRDDVAAALRRIETIKAAQRKEHRKAADRARRELRKIKRQGVAA